MEFQFKSYQGLQMKHCSSRQRSTMHFAMHTNMRPFIVMCLPTILWFQMEEPFSSIGGLPWFQMSFPWATLLVLQPFVLFRYFALQWLKRFLLKKYHTCINLEMILNHYFTHFFTSSPRSHYPGWRQGILKPSIIQSVLGCTGTGNCFNRWWPCLIT